MKTKTPTLIGPTLIVLAIGAWAVVSVIEARLPKGHTNERTDMPEVPNDFQTQTTAGSDSDLSHLCENEQQCELRQSSR